MNSKFYVSLEAARLLKEKGYDLKRDFLTPVYNENGCLYWSNHEDLSDYTPAITKSEAIDWLESKGIVIATSFTYNRKWFCTIKSLVRDEMVSTLDLPTRLEAEEAAINTALELL